MSTVTLHGKDRLGRPIRRRDPYERLMERTQAEGDCIVFTGKCSPKGYGRINIPGRGVVFAHRLAWEHHHGPVPDGLLVRHSCDNPPCVREGHLLVGTNADNSRDMVERGRSPRTRGELSGKAKYSDAQVDRLHVLVDAGMSPALAAREVGIRESYATKLLAGARRAHQARSGGAVRHRQAEHRRDIALARASGMSLPELSRVTGHNTGTIWYMIEQFKREHPADASEAGLLRPKG